MKVKKKWLVLGGVVLTALSGTGYIINCTSNKQKIRQESGSGDNASAGRDLEQTGRDKIEANGDVTITTVTGDTTPNKEADITIISSDHQTGGITAKEVIVLHSAMYFSNSGNKPAIKQRDNYSCVIDTAEKLISFRPKVGIWNATFAGIPNGEKEKVSPHFINQQKNIQFIGPSVYKIGNDSVYAIRAVNNPASNQQAYSLKYKELPSYFIFGDYPSTLYKVGLSDFH